jgi:hypothetical protein
VVRCVVECAVWSVVAVVVIARPVHFDDGDPRAMLRHLDGWARRGLGSPEGWGSVLERCGQWVDYSPRNQVLLASYGLIGPVAGSASWALLESTETGRGCAVRAGEHGVPVRVPMLDTAGVASDRSRTGARSGSVAGGLRWEPVFALEQLARRPAPGVVREVVVPSMSERDRVEAVRVATGRVLGLTPRKIDDPVGQLATLAGRVSHGSGRLRLSPELAGQAGWLVADRLGWGPGPMPSFDPTGLSPRERWRTAVDIRHSVEQLLVGVSYAVGVDLRASALPRRDLVDDRVVAPERRNYLAPADVRGLPLGMWVEAGPYTRAEWLARGVAGAVGVAAVLRVNDRSYLAAYETRTGATWRLETSGRGAHHGLVAEGPADDLTAAKDSARAALQERYPDAARAVESERSTAVIGPQHGWVTVEGGRDDRSQLRAFDERVAAMVSPGPGGRWQTWASVDGTPHQGPLVADVDIARTTAEELARGALMQLATVAPDRANAMVHDLATNREGWDRSRLVEIVGHRLTDTDRAELASTTDADRLVGLMRSTGVLAPAAMMRVLQAEHVDATIVVDCVPALGMPIPDAMRMLHDEWRLDRLDAGATLGATVEELRAAGCTAVEMLAAAPREELRQLDTRAHTWELVAPTLLEAGYTPAEAVAHLAAHAPTPATFAAGVTMIVEDPIVAFVYSRTHAGVDDLAALSERFDLTPAETAKALCSAACPIDRAAAVIDARCPDDSAAASAIITEAYGHVDIETTSTNVAVAMRPDIAEETQLVSMGVDL